MPMISISMFPGRTDEQKRALVKEVTEVVSRTCHTPPQDVWITITEVPREHWSIGGKLYSDPQHSPER